MEPANKHSSEANFIRAAIPAGAQHGAFGHFERCSKNGLGGWAVNLDRAEGVTRVSAYINGQRIGGTQCSLLRADIAGIIGQRIPCGFWLNWENCEIDESVLKNGESEVCRVEVRVDDLDLPLESSCVTVSAAELREWTKARREQAQQLGRGLAENHPATMTAKGLAEHLDSIPGQAVLPTIDPKDVKLIAYYLPQFHPIPENDEWWGPGFTEWTNVSQASPLFRDHYQPHIPGELGFYDLRLPEAREAQARLAREHGIYGFCYYYYWFAGRRLLERPLQEVLESGKPDFPFCICWANENWSRRWDGSEQEILVEQLHNEQTDVDFIRDVIPLFRDPRYIRIKGAPLLIIYRVSLIPEPSKTAARWREICAESGFPDIHLCMSETFGLTEPRQYGFDSSVQFPPHGVAAPSVSGRVQNLAEGFSGTLFDYDDVVQDQLAREAPTYRRFPGVMTAWDNTPRKHKAGHAFLNATPEAYEVWLRGAIDQARERLPEGERIVFINAWNEWAEGAHLEPDRKYGRAYLEATRRALTGHSDWKLSLEYADQVPALSGEAKARFLAEQRSWLERLSKVNRQLLALMGEQGLAKRWTVMKPGLPFGMSADSLEISGKGRIEHLNRHRVPYRRRVAVERSQKLLLLGWSFCPQVPIQADTPTYLVFRDVATNAWHHALIVDRLIRMDVVEHFPDVSPDATQYAGVRAQADISAVPAGCYVVGVAYRGTGRAFVAMFEGEVEIA